MAKAGPRQAPVAVDDVKTRLVEATVRVLARDGRAVMELIVGARTSPVLATEVRSAIDRALDFATTELDRVLGGSPIEQLVPLTLLAELAAAAFLGLEVLTQNGREIDLDRLAAAVAAGIQLIGAFLPK